MAVDICSDLSNTDGASLIDIARRAILSAVIGNIIPEISTYPPALNILRGVFVSLYCCGVLRGCVGHVENPGPLAQLVVHTAVHAALHDPRFQPVSAEEVSALKIELSVLSQLHLIEPKDIVVGRHGLMIIQEKSKGLLLPQVATKRRWSRERFLDETCAKAGVPRDTWRDPKTKVFAFTAQVFSDPDVRVLSTQC